MRVGFVMGVAVAAWLVVAGCSTAPDASASGSVVGDWVYVSTRPDVTRALAVTFNGDGTFAWNFLDLKSAAKWDQVLIGSYDETAAEITLVPHQSTCAQNQRAIVWPYSLGQDQLSVMNGDEPITLTRNVDPSITAGVTLACLVDETFTPSALVSIDNNP